MVAPSDIRYASASHGRIAYEVLGDGPIDLLRCNEITMVSIDSIPGEPHWDAFDRKLASFARLIRFDRRGIGLSDGPSPGCALTVEQFAQDALTVLDAAGSKRAAVFGMSGGFTSITLCAMAPERVSHLVLFNAWAHFDAVRGLPWTDGFEQWLEEVTGPQGSATVDDVAAFSPSLADDRYFRAWWQQAGRRGASPAAALDQNRVIFTADLRPSLEKVHVPTLVIQRRDAPLSSVEESRRLAAMIADARYVELPGADLFPFAGNADAVADEIEEFLTGARSMRAPDRALTTVLFTDIVDSTKQAASMGDREWSSRLDQHDAMIRRQLRRFGGREVKNTGDGFLATFDAPTRAIQFGLAVSDEAHGLGLEIKVGIHAGEVELRGDDVGGLSVHIGSRVADLGEAGEVLVSSTVKDLVVGSGVVFEERGSHELKGVPGTWTVHRVAGR